MTRELLEFRKWGIVAALIEKLTEGTMEPVVLNMEGVSMLIIHGDKAFFFYSPTTKVIIVQTWTADASQMIESKELFATAMPDVVTFREIAHLSIAKALNL